MIVRRIVGGLFLCSRRALCARTLHPPSACPPPTPRPPLLLPAGSLFQSLFYSTNAAPVEQSEAMCHEKPGTHGYVSDDAEPVEQSEAKPGSHDVLSDDAEREEQSETVCPKKRGTHGSLSEDETRKLLKLIEVDELRRKLQESGKNCMPYEEFTEFCRELGAVSSDDAAEDLAKILDEAGVILIFRNKVFLRPEKVAELLARVIPLQLAEENDPRKEELLRLRKEKEEIDTIAHRQVRRMLWTALLAFSCQSVLFFRLTFWDLSWDVMEPITFFVTSSGLIFGFLFFILTSRDPSYNDLMHTILSSKQRKLMKKRKFDMERFKQLQTQCCSPHFDKVQNVGHSLRR